jgi:hypothetical protein
MFEQTLFGLGNVHARFELPSEVTLHQQNLRTLLSGLGVIGQPRLSRTVLGGASANLRDEPILFGAGPPPAEIFAWLRRSPPDLIRREEGLPTRPDHLLYLLARHAVLLTYASVAFEIHRGAGSPEGGTRVEPSVVDIMETDTRTLGRRAGRTLPGGMTKPLHELTATDHPAAAALDDMRAALDHLSTVPPDRLEALLAGTLDLFAYRLDSWITSLATSRLSELRRAAPTGVLVGGFGWLEDVRARPARPVATPPPDEPGPLVTDPASAGFVHAPSLNQAATAAVLRAGYVAAGPPSGTTSRSPFAVDLSSRRVRLAEQLLDGVRSGQPLGALLGYRLERSLHDRRLDQYIAVFRRIAPFGELAKAQVLAEDTKAEADRLRALPHPDLAAANAALTTAQRTHTQLTQERDRLPGQLTTTQNRLRPLQDERARLLTTLQRLENILRRFPDDERANEQHLEASRRMREVTTQITNLQAEVTRIQRRQTEIGPLITNAARDLTDATRRVNELRRRPHPGLAAADKAANDAKLAFEALLNAARERRLYPPAAKVEALEAVEAMNVVDGLALLQLHQRGAIPFGKKGLPAPNTQHHAALLAELAALEATVDAVADALTAESVHQLVQGNPMRAGASLDAVARREVPPPELEFARTPRTGVALTHRVLVLANASTEAAPGWPTDARQVRAAAEPWLNRWAAGSLGDPAAIRCDIVFRHPTLASPVRRDVRVRNAGLGPLDILAMVDETGRARPELERYLADRSMATRPATVPADAEVQVVFDRQPDWPANVRSLAEALEVARALNAVLADARSAGPADLAPPDVAPLTTIDLAELRARADAVVRRVGVAQAALERAVAPTASSADLRAALVQMLFVGIAESVPAVSVGDAAVEELRERATAVLAECARRLAAARAAETGLDRATATVEQQRDVDVARVRALLGPSFVMLPRLVPTAGSQLAAAFGAGEDRFGGDRTAPSTWLHRAARVRRGVERLQTVLLYAAVGGRSGRVGVAQLPFLAGERWVGLPVEPGKVFPGGRVSLVAHLPDALDAVKPIAGLFVDEWVEVVPNQREITGVACNFDDPAAQPPQAVLVAVAPPGETRWGIDLLEAILLETLDLARMRAVTPEQLASHTDVEEVLPALYFSFNVEGATVSTDFTRAMAGGG